MQAVVLAGGKGTHLYPITSSTPKAMVNLFNKPVLEHTIELLKRHDIHDIVITLSGEAEQVIDYFGGGSKWGVNIQYSLEDLPKGTAGSLRRIQPVLNGTFVVIPTDAVTDFDLKAAVDFHKTKSTIATMLLSEADDPSPFGIVESDADGKIIRFIEKPSPSEVFTNTINTGIYVLEPEVLSYIPYDTACDFAGGVLPRLLQNQEPLYSYRAEGHWCDIRGLTHYRNVHFDVLAGKIKLNLPASRITDGIWVAENASIHPSVSLRPPLYVGNGVRISKNSTLGRLAIIGDTGLVGENAEVTHSILGVGASVAKQTRVYGSVVGSGYTLSEGRHLTDEVVVRNGSGTDLTAEIDPGLLSQLTKNEHAFTWSGLELSRLVAEVS